MSPSRPGSWIVLAASLALAACTPSGSGIPSEEPNPTESAASATPVSVVATWTSRPFGYADIEAALGEASLPPGDVAFLADDLAFGPWPADEQSPEIVVVFALGEDGTWATTMTAGGETIPVGAGTAVTDATTITLTPGESGDGIILAAELAGDTLNLRLLRIVRTGSHEEAYANQLRAAALYQSAPFTRASD
jgi:hypothetical protein